MTCSTCVTPRTASLCRSSTCSASKHRYCSLLLPPCALDAGEHDVAVVGFALVGVAVVRVLGAGVLRHVRVRGVVPVGVTVVLAVAHCCANEVASDLILVSSEGRRGVGGTSPRYATGAQGSGSDLDAP